MIFDENLGPQRPGTGDQVAVTIGNHVENVVRHVLRAAGVDSHLRRSQPGGGVQPAVGPAPVGLPGILRRLINVCAIHRNRPERKPDPLCMITNVIDESKVDVAQKPV